MRDLAEEYDEAHLDELIRRFLFDQLHADGDGDNIESSDVELAQCPKFYGRVAVYRTAHATFYAANELSGDHGMHRELIRSNLSWRGHPRFDTVLINFDPDQPGMQGMAVGRVKGLMRIKHQGTDYPCALIDWFDTVSPHPSDVTGMFIVTPELSEVGEQLSSIVHLDAIVRAVHLMPFFGDTTMPLDFHYSYSLDAFDSFYVNKYGDYHSHQCIF